MHSLRHSFASCLASQGFGLHEIAVLLGHSQLSTTRRYAHYASDRLVSTASRAAEAWKLLSGPVTGYAATTDGGQK